jgi:hypothetical protein
MRVAVSVSMAASPVRRPELLVTPARDNDTFASDLGRLDVHGSPYPDERRQAAVAY